MVRRRQMLRVFASLVIGAALAACAGTSAFAHHSPNDVIEVLSVRMEEHGATAPLLVQRAFEYRAIGDDAAAEADLRAALEREPDSLDALIGLARVLVNSGRLEDAKRQLDNALGQEINESAAAPFHAIYAELREAQARWEDALRHWDQALRSSRPEVDWFLRHADVLRELGRIDDARVALERAKARNPSVVIHRAWLMAMIDAGHYTSARFHIESELAASRWKSSWLLMRARLNAASGKHADAELDAQLALDEIGLRKNPAYPDPFLLLDESLALALLGKNAEAQARLDDALALNVPQTAARHVRSILSERVVSKRH